MNNISDQYVPMEILCKFLFKLKPEDLSKMSQTSKEFNSYAEYIWNHKNYDTEENRRILAELNFTTNEKILNPAETFTSGVITSYELVANLPNSIDAEKLKIQMNKIVLLMTHARIENSVKVLTLPELKKMVEFTCSSYGKSALPKITGIESMSLDILMKNMNLINLEDYLK